ncbi:Chorismate synthase [Rhodococcus wratislaviensis]|uniref:chorismate synthase n=1 Tax=Rhodococcus wratislaviensis TaxID=44752 RepID=A0A402C2T7_RHOWR|nr:Chorismate synthase [Rhodococcus wratislaviensis]
MIKFGFTDARPVLERASARETAARVAAGTIAKAFLRQTLGVEVLSHVVAIGDAEAPAGGPVPAPDALGDIDASPVRAATAATPHRMLTEIETAKREGDTLGGVFEVCVHGLPIGLGSYTSGDSRIDGQT